MKPAFSYAILPLAIISHFSLAAPADNIRSLAVKQADVGGENYRFIKYHNSETGRIEQKILDGKGKEVTAGALKKTRPSKLGRALSEKMAKADDALIPVELVFTAPAPETVQVSGSQGSAGIDAGGQITLRRNGMLIGEQDVARDLALKSAQRITENKNKQQHIKNIKEKLKLNHVWLKKPLALHGGEASHIRADLTAAQINELLAQSDGLLDGIDLYSEGEAGLDSAMLDTRVDPYALNYSARRGNDVGIYMTEGTCPDPGHITGYTRLAGSTGDHAENVAGILRGVAPDSHVYCRAPFQVPTTADYGGSGGNPAIHILTTSWGWYNVNDYKVQDRDWDNAVYNNKVLAFALAGNLKSNHEIWSPGKALNVVTVGNYVDSTDTINSSSCYTDPQTKNQKPELAAPGTNITAGGHSNYTGTSMATPHAAAFAADLFSSYNWLKLKPAYAKAFMLAGAKKTLSGGGDKVGVGGLDFYDAYYSSQNYWWEGGNGYFNTAAAGDGGTDSNAIEKTIAINASSGHARVAFTWLNRGDYTYAHRGDTNAMGMDFDISVYDPSGNLVGSSSSFDNPYEVVDFDPVVTGNYKIKIQRTANRDTASKFHAGLSVNW
ncbi:S8/S53 family peptidase [Thalassomonas viridans]|uniref:S8/S53 family peptidase n=1 Tax=Thalassomonas viridans TaxID=137584 RepID=A0AAE9ZAN7_9GAMM|nr:S8/S53 family peptidase [Thalassomonas viridans]WDE07997.1 S8/S53 family peptidase [Thalassomonas viridans]